jgi:hypothetical protein
MTSKLKLYFKSGEEYTESTVREFLDTYNCSFIAVCTDSEKGRGCITISGEIDVKDDKIFSQYQWIDEIKSIS